MFGRDYCVLPNGVLVDEKSGMPFAKPIGERKRPDGSFETIYVPYGFHETEVPTNA